VVICVHGLAGNRGQFLEEAVFLEAKGFGVLLLDLRNHGQSQGTKTTFGLDETRDLTAAVEFIRQREGPGVRIAAFGHSMGSAVVLLAAAEIPEINAVIAANPFTSLEDNVSQGVRILTGLDPAFFAPLVLFWGQREAGIDLKAVRPVEVIGRLSPRAVLLIHGAQDELLPVENSYQLYAAAGEPKELVIYAGVGHGGYIFQEPQRYPKTVIKFLGKYLLP
jgi:alpha-beta hydrolase superfamily lysophospholipase